MTYTQPLVFSPLKKKKITEFSKAFLTPGPDWATFIWAEPHFPRGKPSFLNPIMGSGWTGNMDNLRKSQKEITLEISMQPDTLVTSLVRRLSHYNLMLLSYSLGNFIHDEFLMYKELGTSFLSQPHGNLFPGFISNPWTIN